MLIVSVVFFLQIYFLLSL